MTQTSIGFAGSVDDKQWARLGRLLGAAPALERIGDLPIAPVGGQRVIQIGTNAADASSAAPRSSIYGDGVLTDLTAAETVTIPTPSAGQWFLVVCNRNWATRSSVFAVRAGGLTSASNAGARIPDYPATLVRDPGTNADIPVAWVWANASTTTLTIVPLLAPSRAVFPRTGTTADRTAMFATVFPVNGNAAALLKFGEVAGEWYNSTGNWTDRYFGPRAIDAGSIVDVARPAGWYPVHGQLPQIDFAHDPSYDMDIPGSNEETTLVGFPDNGRNYWGNGGQGEPALGLSYGGLGVWNVGQPGRWQITAYGRWTSGGSGGGRRAFGARSASRGLITYDRRGPSTIPYISLSGEWVVPAGGDTLSLVAAQDSGSTLPFHVFSAHLAYLGPN